MGLGSKLTVLTTLSFNNSDSHVSLDLNSFGFSEGPEAGCELTLRSLLLQVSGEHV